MIPNLGSITFFLGLYPIMFVLLIILRITQSMCKGGCLRQKLKLRRLVFWGWPIDFLTDNFIVIGICVLINLRNISWENKETILNTGLSMSLMALLVFYPILMQRFLYNKRHKIKQRGFKSRFG